MSYKLRKLKNFGEQQRIAINALRFSWLKPIAINAIRVSDIMPLVEALKSKPRSLFEMESRLAPLKPRALRCLLENVLYEVEKLTGHEIGVICSKCGNKFWGKKGQEFCSFYCGRWGTYDKRKGSKHRRWKEAVLKRDGYACVVCKRTTSYLVAHHKDGYTWCTKRRFEVSNGATLCDSLCHVQFHRRFGTWNNTEEQWNKFRASFKPKLPTHKI